MSATREDLIDSLEPDKIRAITVRHPWPLFILRGWQRSLSFLKYTVNWEGPLLIHASTLWDNDYSEVLERIVFDEHGLFLLRERHGCSLDYPDSTPIDYVPNSQFMALTTFTPDRTGGRLGTIHRIPGSVRVRGWPGVWTPHAAHLELVRQNFEHFDTCVVRDCEICGQSRKEGQ